MGPLSWRLPRFALLPAAAAVLLAALALARSALRRVKPTLDLPRPVLRECSSAPSKVRFIYGALRSPPLARFGPSVTCAEHAQEYSRPSPVRVLRVPPRGYGPAFHGLDVQRVQRSKRCGLIRSDPPAVAQASADGLGEADAKSEASALKPTKPAKVGARTAAGSTGAAEPGGSGTTAPAPSRSAPLTLNRTLPHKAAAAFGARGARPQQPRVS